MFFILILFVLFVILIVKLSKKTNDGYRNHQYGPAYDLDEIDEELMMHQMMYEEGNDRYEDHSPEVYPDMYSTDPEDMMYFGEDGDILEYL